MISQSSDEPVELDRVVIRTNQSPATARTVIERADLRRQLYRTTPQALRDVPGVMVQETSAGQGSPYLRGFTGYQNLFLIDGIRLNNSVFRAGPNQYWNTVDAYLLERIEVRPGAQSSRHGSDAIGGVVDVTTLAPNLPDERDSTAEATYRVSSAENSHAGHIDVSHRLGAKTALRAGGTVKSFGDLISGEPTGRQPNTGYDEWDADAKLVHTLHENARVTLAYQHVRQDDVPRTHRTVFAIPFAGTTAGGELQRSLDQQRQLAYARLETSPGGGIDRLEATVSWQRQDEKRFRSRAAGIDLQGFTVNTFSAQSTLSSDTRLGLLEYGFDYYRDFVDSFSSGNAIQGPVADDASYDLLGLFLRDRIDANEAVTLTFGGRYQFAAVAADRVRDPVTALQTSLSDN